MEPKHDAAVFSSIALGVNLTIFCNVSAGNRQELYGFAADYMGFAGYAAGTVKTVPYIGGELGYGAHTAT